MNMKKLSVIGLIVLIGCSTSKLASPNQSDVDRVAEKYPDYSLADLNQGKTLFQQNCGKCHGLKDPKEYNEDQWNKIVPPMVKKVNKNGLVLDEKAQKQILRYVVTMSSKP